jgi:hypothetical protein
MARHRIAAALLAVLALTAAIAGCGSGGEAPPPFSVSDSAVRTECFTGTFLPDVEGVPLVRKGSPADWRTVEDEPGAYASARGAAEVVIRPRENQQKLTLTKIDFDVSTGERPIGVVFYRPCKRHVVGPAVVADVDQEPDPIVASSADPNGSLGIGWHLPKHSEPIHFPWTVDLTKPLHLYLVAKADYCYCVWSARISWKSGDQEGVIHVDNGGKRYRVVEGYGMVWRKPTPDGGWVYPATPAWVGVR